MNKNIKKGILLTISLAMISSYSTSVYAENNKQDFVDSFMDKIEKNEESVATSNKLLEDKESFSIEDVVYPSGKVDMKDGIVISGTIKSDVKIKNVTFKITDKYEDNVYSSYEVNPKTNTYKISEEICNQLKIVDLDPGCYKLVIIAENANDKSAVLLSSVFDLTGTKSELKSSVKLSDTEIAEGHGSYVSGKITSNYKITSVTVEIVDSKYSITVKPNKKSYTISEEVDSAMRFDKLDEGKYTLKVTAKDASGATVTQTIKLTVEACDYKKISYSIVGVRQRTRSDCAFASMATCELYFSMNGNGAFGSLLANSSDPYNALKKKNGNSTYGYWSRIGYQKVYSNSLTKLYNGLKKGPVIVHKAMESNGSHYSVVYGYQGSNDKLYSKYFQVYEVTNGARMDLNTWLTSYSSFNINGPGRFDHMCIKK